jgi:hypothetical protein
MAGLIVVCVAACRRAPPPEKHEGPSPAVVPDITRPEAPPQIAEPPPIISPKPVDARAKAPTRRFDEARNQPLISLLLADRLGWLDKIVTLRVHASVGDYFNCYYKGRKASYRHLRLRGDGSAYLDAYLPRDTAGEKLWLQFIKKKIVKLTVKAITRAETASDICIGQVEILDHRLGWDFDTSPVGEAGVLKRRIQNARDRQPIRNTPSVRTILQARGQFVGKEFQLNVRGRIGRYFQCRYRDAERTHYAFFLRGNGFKGLRAYHLRNERGKELAQLLARDEGRRLNTKLTVRRGRYDEFCPDQVEILTWSENWVAPAGGKP